MWIWISPGGLAMMAIVLIPLVSTNPNPNRRAMEKTSLNSNTGIELLRAVLLQNKAVMTKVITQNQEVITQNQEVITQNRILTALLGTSGIVRKVLPYLRKIIAFKSFFQILWKIRCNILVSFPSH